MLKIERVPSSIAIGPQTLGELSPGDVFWQPQYGSDVLYMVVATNSNTRPDGFGINEWQTYGGDLDVLVVRLCGDAYKNPCPHLCKFSVGNPIVLVDATLMVSEHR